MFQNTVTCKYNFVKHEMIVHLITHVTPMRKLISSIFNYKLLFGSEFQNLLHFDLKTVDLKIEFEKTAIINLR